MTDSTTPQDSEAMSPASDGSVASDAQMGGIDEAMAKWRRSVWGTGPCPVSSQENLTLTDAEREAIKEAGEFYIGTRTGAALSGLLERLGGER